MLVAINTRYGGFTLSDEVYDRLKNFHGIDSTYANNDDFGINTENEDAFRADERLIMVLQNLINEGININGGHAEIALVEIPDDIKWYISDYDGIEEIHEEHRRWN